MRMLFTTLMLLAVTLAPDRGCHAQNPSVVAHADGAAMIVDAMQADHIPGMAVAVYRGDELIWHEAFGVADLEHHSPATVDTKFRLGSVSKVFAATLAVRLAQEGRVELDAPIRDVLPEWPEKHPPITLRQLLGHLGGVRHYTPQDYNFQAPGGPIDLRVYPNSASILALFADDELVAPPGERFSYSTFGYSLAGLVMEAATATSFADLLTEEVLQPLGISEISVDDPFQIIENRTRFYDPVQNYRGLVPESAGPVVNSAPLNSAYKQPGGGLIGDAEAVAKFGTALFAPGFIEDEMYHALFSPQETNAGESTGTAIGWRVATDDAGRTYYHHSGSQQGCRAHLSVYPEQELSIAILSNLGNHPQDIGSLAGSIAALFVDSDD